MFLTVMSKYKREWHEKIKLGITASWKLCSLRNTRGQLPLGENPSTCRRSMAPVCSQAPSQHVACLISPLAPPICLIPLFSSPWFTGKWESHKRSCKTSQIQKMTHITRRLYHCESFPTAARQVQISPSWVSKLRLLNRNVHPIYFVATWWAKYY